MARAALELTKRGIELVVISLGSQGAVACSQGAIFDAIAPEVKAKSSIGSGDSLIAGLMCGLEKGLSLEESLALGCAAGAATAMSDGTCMGAKDDIDGLIPQAKVTRIALPDDA